MYDIHLYYINIHRQTKGAWGACPPSLELASNMFALFLCAHRPFECALGDQRILMVGTTGGFKLF